MKNIKLYTLMLAVCGLCFTSCEKDDNTGDSNATERNVSATITNDVPAIVTEDDATMYTISVELSEPQIVDIKFNITQTGGNADAADYKLSANEIYIPAYYTSGSATLTILNDTNETEGQEELQLQVGDGATGNVNFTPSAFTVKIDDVVTPPSDALDMTFDWSGSATLDWVDNIAADEETRAFCSYVDLDILVFDADGNDLGIYGAATGSCPEALTFDGLDDGDYYLNVNLWTNAGILPADPSVVVPFPITATFTQTGVFESVIEQAAANVITSADADGITTPLAKVTVSGTTYTIEAL